MKLEFAQFVVDTQSFRLLCEGREVPLERRTFDLLHYLLVHRDRVIAKEELLENVWGAKVLSEGVLSNAVAKLRRAVGQRAGQKHPIETVHGRGYRFHLPNVQSSPTLAREALEGVRPDPFVGRASLMQRLNRQLERVGEAGENLVLLTGEPGIGKTRTVRELAQHASARGMACFVGAAYEAGSPPPYFPFTQVLRSAYESLGDAAFRGCLGPGSWALAQLVPELVSAAPPVSLDPPSARFHLFDELSRFLRRAAALRPALIALEDLHAADRGTLELLAFAARSLAAAPVMFVATLRLFEAGPARARDAIPSVLGGFTSHHLEGLAADELEELATELFDHELSEAELQTLHERTRGNPLFVRQALDLAAQQTEPSLTALAWDAPDLTHPLREILRKRIAMLPEATQKLLATAAVIGQRFTTPLLAEVSTQDAANVLDQLEPALRSDVIEVVAHEDDSFEFAHALIQQCLYETLTLRNRGELHKRVADCLTRREGPDARRMLAALAHHRFCALPFELEPAIVACRRAAAAAHEASGFEAAAQLLERAVHKLGIEAGPPQLRARLLLELGEQQFLAGALESAWASFSQAAQTEWYAAQSTLLAEIAPRLADCLEVGVGDYHYAAAAVERALDQLPEDALSLRASLLAHRAELGFELEADERFAVLDQAARLADAAHDRDAQLEVAHSRAIVRDVRAIAESEQAARAFLELLDREPSAHASVRYRSLRRFNANLTLYLMSFVRGDAAGADAALEECAHIADESHVRAAQWGVLLMRAGRALAARRLDALRELLSSATWQIGTELPFAKLAYGRYMGALIEAEQPFDPAAAEMLDRAALEVRVAGRHATYVLLERARAAASAGAHDRARVLLARLSAGELARMPVRYGDLGALCGLAQTYALLRDRERARELYAQLLPFCDLNAVGPAFDTRGSVTFFLGLLAETMGDDAQARVHFARATQHNRELGYEQTAAHGRTSA